MVFFVYRILLKSFDEQFILFKAIECWSISRNLWDGSDQPGSLLNHKSYAEGNTRGCYLYDDTD